MRSVARRADSFFPGRGDDVAALWRTKQIDYTRLRTMSGPESERYAPFSAVTRDALRYTARALGLALDESREDALMREYDRLACFDDARRALVALQARGLPMAILSNGDPPMLAAVVAANGLDGVFDHLLSVDTVRAFKTAPAAYALGPAALGCDAREIVFVSSNAWDACGATWYGYTTFWINRAGAPAEELGVAPHATGATMDDVLGFLDTHRT